jgi:hypothetical protein
MLARKSQVLCPILVAERGLLAHKLRHLLLDDIEKQVNRYHELTELFGITFPAYLLRQVA